jgi:hypothetical protein
LRSGPNPIIHRPTPDVLAELRAAFDDERPWQPLTDFSSDSPVFALDQ